MTQISSSPWTPAADAQREGDARLFAPATQRNRDAILDVLRPVLPEAGTVLEIASGSGEHVVHFAQALPHLTFQPSDPSPEALASIAAWANSAGTSNVATPVQIDAMSPDWPVVACDAMLCINMIHIAPFAAAEGLFRQAGRLLAPGAPLYLYGPYIRRDRPLEPSNAAFDASLRQRDPEWGLRDLDEVTALTAASGFGPAEITEMPANNLSLVFRKRATR
jgi:SAM-dependent methyltransferase